MIRPTLAQLIGSDFPAAIGICPDDVSLVASKANIVQERLMSDPMTPEEGWWGGWAEYVFNLQVTNYTARLIAPREVARPIVLDICQRPRPIRNGFYEYLSFSTGKLPKNCQTWREHPMQALERGNSVTLTDFSSGPQILRAYASNSADYGKRVQFQGFDKNGLIVYGVDSTTGEAIEGETVLLQTPFATAANQYTALNGLLKDQTLGPVSIFMVDATGNQTLLTTMAPSETTAYYRVFAFNALPTNCCNTASGTVQVTAQCRLDFVPVQSPPDYLRILSIPALIEEGQAYRYSQMDTTAAAQLEAKHHTKALQLLCGQLDAYQGKTGTAIGVPIFGSAKLRPQPI